MSAKINPFTGKLDLVRSNTDIAQYFFLRDQSTPQSVTGFPAFEARDLTLSRIGTPTYSTLQDLQNTFHSAGWISGGDITDAGGETIDVAAGAGYIRSSASATAPLFFFDWAGVTGQSVPTDEVRYVGVEYNAGSPQVTLRSSQDWDYYTDFPLGRVINEGGTLHIVLNPQAVGDHASTMLQRLYDTLPLARGSRDGGLILGETGTRNVTMTAGSLWDRLNKFEIAAIDTSASDTFDLYSSAGLEATAQTQWDNLNYDNGGTVTELSGLNYGILWFYIETDGDLICVYGTDSYPTLGGAEDATPPSTLPARVVESGRLLGRFIFQKNAGTTTIIDSAFEIAFNPSVVTVHNDLSGLQGGTADEYYHLTADEYTALQGGYVKVDGTTPLTANWGVGGFQLSNLTLADTTGLSLDVNSHTGYGNDNSTPVFDYGSNNELTVLSAGRLLDDILLYVGTSSPAAISYISGSGLATLSAAEDTWALSNGPTGAVASAIATVGYVDNSLVFAVDIVTDATYSITTANDLVVCNRTTAMTVTLPAATGTGNVYTIKNVNTGLVTLDGNSSETIDGALSLNLSQYDSVSVQDYDSGKWVIV